VLPDLLARFGLPTDPTLVLVAGGLVVARVLALLTFVPAFGVRSLPAPVRVALAVVLAAVLYPSVALRATVPASPIAIAALALKEVLVGATMGFVVALAFAALDMAGRLVDATRGATLAEVLDPLSGERTSPLAELHVQVGLLVFLALGGPRALVLALAHGYETVPLASFPAAARGLAPLAGGAIRLAGDSIAVAFVLAAPALVALYLSELALGLFGRAAPQVGVFFVGMPLRAAVGIAAVLLALTAMTPAIAHLFGAALEAARHAPAWGR
jgi:flagellar biosynthetic protein FliR